MKMDKVAGSGNDEFYTPPYAIAPIIEYLKKTTYRKIWCPFDTEKSNFVKILFRNGFEVVYSHLEMGYDFFETDVDCDAIVSNPPYSLKNEVFNRLFKLGKPFAMLVGVVGLFESEKRFSMFEENDFEILYLNKRISYFKSYDDQKPSLNPPFSSVYVTRYFLPAPICFARVSKS